MKRERFIESSTTFVCRNATANCLGQSSSVQWRVVGVACTANGIFEGPIPSAFIRSDRGRVEMSPIATTPDAPFGPWNPGIESQIPNELRPLETIFRADNVFTSV